MSDEESARDAGIVGRASAALGGNTVYLVANGLLILLLTRELLSPTDFGTLYFAISVLTVGSIFAILGIPKSAARYVNEYTEQDPAQVPHILRRTMLAMGLLVGLVGLVLFLGHERIAALLDSPEVAPFLLLGPLYVAGYALHSLLLSLFQGFNRIRWSASLNALSGIGRLVFVVALVLAGFEAVGAFVGYVAGFGLAAVVGLVLLYRHHYADYEEAPEMESGLTRRLVEYSLPLTLTKGAGVLDKRVDIILVGALLNPVAVGYYVVAKQVSEITSVPASSLGYTVSPELGTRSAMDRTDRAARLYERALRYVMLFYLPACVGLVLVADPAIPLIFGRDYAGAVPVVQVMSGFVLVNSVNKITSDGLDYLGRARERALMKSGTAGANFLLNLLLIPVFGVVGAAVATVATYTVYTLGNVYYIHRAFSLRLGALARVGAGVTLITAAMGVAVVLALPYISGPFTLAGVILLGGGVWAVLSLASGLVDVEQVSALL
ncbi:MULTISPECIES: oligosaccharide flippase family protein [Salinibaculum]|uniref:oligosaccharide flippase family protein n=1 Tax=Salinibaculum TaxID=2732368 RepID=UPI0030D4A9A9